MINILMRQGGFLIVKHKGEMSIPINKIPNIKKKYFPGYYTLFI